MKKLLVILVLALGIGAEAEAKTYKIGMVPWIAWTPFNIADVKGIWKDQGIDVQVIIFKDSLQMDKMFKENRVDIITEMIGTSVGMATEGFPVAVIAEIDWSHGGDKLIIKKDADPAKIKGSPVGIYMNQPSVTYFLNLYMKDIGLKVSDVKLIEMEVQQIADKFISGVFNTIVCYDPDALRAEQNGGGKVVATSASYDGCIPEGLLIMKDTLKEIPKQDLVKIFKGWISAVKWSKDKANWKEYTDIVNQHTFKADKPYSDAEITDMLNAVRIHDEEALKERNQKGGGLDTYLKNVKAFMKENNLLVKDFESEDLSETEILMEAIESP